jgi:plasmid stabilization system protein ParE
MKLVWSRRALGDLHDIAAYYVASASPAIPKLRRDSRSGLKFVWPPSFAIHFGYSIVSARTR